MKSEKYTEHIDLVFANAGYGRFAPVEYVDENQFDELFNILVKGPFFYGTADVAINEKRKLCYFQYFSGNGYYDA